MMTDPVADMLTRIRNANRIERPAVDIPAPKLKRSSAQVLKDEGFIIDFQVGEAATDEHGSSTFQQKDTIGGPQSCLRIFLKYGPEGEKVIRHIERASKPGRRLYRPHKELRP